MGCPEWQGVDYFLGYGGAAMSDDGFAYTGDTFDFLSVLSFPDWAGLWLYNLNDDITYPPGLWIEDEFGTFVTFPNGGMTTTGVDDKLYLWVSNDIGAGQQVIIGLDRSDIDNGVYPAPASVIFDEGETPGIYSYFRSSAIAWHPATPDYLWSVLVQIDPDEPGAFTVGRARLMKHHIATQVTTEVLDLTDIALVGGVFVRGSFFQLHQWDRGLVYVMSNEHLSDDGLIMAFDVTTETYDTHPFNLFGGFGVYQSGLVIGREFGGEVDDHPMQPLQIADGGTITETSSACQFDIPESEGGGHGFPQWWFAPPDRSAVYVTEFGQYWKLPVRTGAATWGSIGWPGGRPSAWPT